MNDDSNILLIDKPKGISSYQVIRILQKKMGKIKMGHAGTLDPLASGLLIIGVKGGTKQLSKLIGLSKIYEAEILLGVRTDSGDLEGKIIEEKSVPLIDESKVKNILKSIVGVLELQVPVYSAIKHKGKPLYAYVRAGKNIDAPVKPMNVYDVELQGISESIIKVRCNVGSGTYIRSLAEEIGKRLGTIATIKNLRRVSIGQYSVENASVISL